jgi:hypothetical protein
MIADISYWAFDTWASVTVHRSTMLMALATLNQPTISVSAMKRRINHGSPYSVSVGFEPFEVCGIVTRLEDVSRTYPTFSIDREKITQLIETWEQIDLIEDSSMRKYIMKHANIDNCIYASKGTANPYAVQRCLNVISKLSMKILYLKERCNVRLDNWITFLNEVMPTHEQISELLTPDSDNRTTGDIRLSKEIDDTYNPIDMNRGFRNSINGFYSMRNETPSKNIGNVLGLPYVTDKEIFNNDGNGEIVCL